MKGILYCEKCKATAQGNSFDEADSIIDHAATSTKCSGNPDFLIWTQDKLTTASESKKKTEPKKSR